MASIFKKTEEEVRKKEMEATKFNRLLENGIKKCSLDESLELLLYDVSDAIKERQILLVEAKDGREEAYLIPLLLAYQNTTFFNSFIIATASNNTRKKIIKSLKNISFTLGIDIPVHILENEKNYVCLKRLKGYNKRRKKEITNPRQDNMKKSEWRKVQVRNCTFSSCQFFRNCKYALAYSTISKQGCSFVSHRSLVNHRFFSHSPKNFNDKDIIIIDDAEKFVDNIRDSYQRLMCYDYICNYFSRARQLLNRTEYSYITNDYFDKLQQFFEELAKCEEGFDWKITEELKKTGKYLANVTKKILIHITRQFAIKSFSRETEQFCDSLLIIEKFFIDISQSSENFHYQLQKKDRSESTPDFRRVQIFYYPKKVDIIIANRLKNEDCSFVFTGKSIAGEEEDYHKLTEECGLDYIKIPKVKEYILK